MLNTVLADYTESPRFLLITKFHSKKSMIQVVIKLSIFFMLETTVNSPQVWQNTLGFFLQPLFIAIFININPNGFIYIK